MDSWLRVEPAVADDGPEKEEEGDDESDANPGEFDLGGCCCEKAEVRSGLYGVFGSMSRTARA